MSALRAVQPPPAPVWQASSSAGPFQLGPWLQHWQQLYGRPADRLVEGAGALLPLVLRREWQARLVPLRTVRFAATGDAEADELAPEFMDLDAEPFGGAAAMVAALRELPMDVCRLENCLADSGAAALCREAHGFQLPAGVRYLLPLPEDSAAWLDTLSASFRGKVKRLQTRMQQQQMRVELASEVTHRASCLPVLERLHGARWQGRGQQGVFASVLFSRFHRALLEEPEVPARIAILYQGDAALAAWYGFDVAGVRYFYQAGMVDGASGFSPGLALHAYMIEDAIARGLDAYDFMKGSADSWKARFGCQQLPVWHYLFTGNSCRGRLVQRLLAARSAWQPAGGTH